jgi:superfamily I DNA/RNA helicase/mRNA-degrading endonuclease RelE of RelBE toxin-antitoxin system
MNKQIGYARIAISSQFLESYSKISKDRQARVRSFIEKFKADPTSPGINYEKIADGKDPNLRSVRIDQQYRAIVLKPPAGNLFMLLWVDNHDDAYQWAKNLQFQVHPDTGALQVLDVTEGQAHRQLAIESSTEDAGLFEQYRDRELVRLGIPEELMPRVRSINTEEELDIVCKSLPDEASEALFMLAAGFSREEVFAEIVQPRTHEEVDTKDFAAALEREDSKRRFAVVDDDQELQQILAAPLEHWRVFLHPSQRKLVQMKANGPVRVLGGAGTGKTVVAMHRARWLAENIFTDSADRILFTTFTKNLALDIKASLHKLCSMEAMQRIEVINIDAWIARFLKQNGYDFEIAYGERLNLPWNNALNVAESSLGLSDQFYRDEWNEIIQTKGIEDVGTYMRADRTGRRERLPRRKRAKVWPVFEEYRSQLSTRRLKESTDAARDARLLLEQMGDVLPYRAVIVDEAQDMGAEVFRLIRQIIPVEDESKPHDIFVVGDPHQRIYGSRVVLSQCGINIHGRGRKLRINYRTTEETRSWAVKVLSGLNFDDLNGSDYLQQAYKSLMHGPSPIVRVFVSYSDEVREIRSRLESLLASGASLEDICLICRTNNLVNQYQGALKSAGYDVYTIRRSVPENRKTPGIRVATMHRVKGLEFDHVIVAGVNDGVVPEAPAVYRDATVKNEQREEHERSLLYVAVTRARKSVLITCSGKPSPFITFVHSPDHS